MISFKKKTLLSVAVAVMLGSAQLPGTSWAAQAPAAAQLPHGQRKVRRCDEDRHHADP